jgi:membrane-bound lytic murein transglycosylase B
MDYRNLAYQTAQKYGLDPDMFVRQIQAESAFNPAAVSSAGAIGLGQLMPATAKELGVDPTDPVQNLEGAARYMKQQLERFGDPALALAAYNAGPSRVAKAGGIPNITETQNYVAKILGEKGGVVMADQQTQPQQSQGLLGGILGGQGIGGALGMSEDFRDRLKMAILLGSDSWL